jgi:hypothetical protein
MVDVSGSDLAPWFCFFGRFPTHVPVAIVPVAPATAAKL